MIFTRNIFSFNTLIPRDIAFLKNHITSKIKAAFGGLKEAVKLLHLLTAKISDIKIPLSVHILSIALILFISQGVSLASDNTPRFWILQDFSKGLNSHISSYNTPDNQANELSNLRINDRYGELSKRDSLLSYGDTGALAVTGLHRFYKSDGTIKLIAATGTLLRYGDDDAGTFTTIKTGLTDGKRWQFVTYMDNAIGTNGYDQPVKWDGYTQTTANTDNSRTAGELCAELGAPFAQLSSENGGNDLDAESWYMYKVAFYDGSTYDYSTARSNPIKTGTAATNTQNLSLTDVPLGPTGTTHRYVYRTLGAVNQATVVADTTYYLVADIADNTTVTINDAVTDGTADDNIAPTWATVSAGTNVTPPKGKYLEIYVEKLYVAGNPTYPSDFYWSDLYNPDHFLPSDFEPVRPDDGDAITFLKVFLGILRIGKTNTIQSVYSDSAALDISNPLSFVGCPAPYSVAVSPKGIVYLGRDGIYLFTGQYSMLISDAVTPEIRDISQTNIAEVVGYYWNNEYRLSYTSEKSGSAVNNRVLLYDFTRDAYTLDTESVNCFASFGAGTDFGTLYSGSSTTDGYVFAHTSSANLLNKRYKSEIDAGTYDDVRSYGTEEAPLQEIAWDCTIAGWLTELQTKDALISTIADIETYLPDATIARPDTSGTWTSPVYDIKAAALDKLYWNEALGAYGDVTLQIRTGDVAVPDVTWTDWCTAVTNPSGSDISGVTSGRYIQVRFNLSTTDISYSPTLYQADGYIFRLSYSKVGAAYETSILSVYQTGKKDFGVQGYKKFIRRIKIYYTGTQGTLNFNIIGDDGDINKTFILDLSISPNASTTDMYSGNETNKIFTFYPPMNSETEPSLISQYFTYTLSETGVVEWNISKIETMFTLEEIY